MNRLILGVIAAATIAAGAPASATAAAVPYVNGGGGGDAVTGSAPGAYLGMVSAKDRITDLDRLDAIETYAPRDSAVIGGGVRGHNAQYRQFACIKVGHRLEC
jgi:hypothetical protein